MKKIFTSLLFIGFFCILNAQNVSETVTLFGKEQLNGFTINIEQTPQSVVEGAIVEKFENQLSLKGSKKKGFYTYMNQNCNVFGDARYDIYCTTAEVGKKKNKATQVTLVVSTGNQNCITFANDPRTARNITSFLENFNNDVEAYKIKLRINELNEQLATLEKERQSLEKDQVKIKEKLTKTNDDMKKTAAEVDAKNAELARLQDEYTSSHNADVKTKISKTAKETQTLRKSQSNMQKSMLNLNDDLQKIDKKIDLNQKTIEKTKTELNQIKR